MNNLIVIGLDGFTWEIADRLTLPAIQKITKNGGRRTLTSTLPPVTCPAWPSFLTGKVPEKHRAFDFAYLGDSKKLHLTNYKNIQGPGLIETLSVNDLQSIFFEIPVTHPAPEEKATVVAGYPSTLTEDKFQPPELFEEIKNKFGKFPPITPSRYTGKNKNKVIKEFEASGLYRKKVFTSLLQNHDWDFATANFHLADQFSHYFWDKFEPEGDGKDPLSRAYKLLDNMVADILETVPDSTNVILMSDHGFGPQKKSINLNYALMQKGFLQLKDDYRTKLKTFLMKMGFSLAKLKKIADRMNLSPLLSKLSRQKRDKLLDSFLSYQNIDWDKTRAFAFGHMGQIYWVGEKEEEKKNLKNYLLSLKTEQGNNLIDDLIPLRENPQKKSLQEPLWLAKMEEWASISYPLLMSSYKLVEKPVYSGCHRPEGILAWAGPDLKPGAPKKPEIIDLAPTIHRLLGIPLQHNFDGRVLQELLDSSAPPPAGTQNYAKPNEDSKQAEEQEEQIEQLKNLGYL